MSVELNPESVELNPESVELNPESVELKEPCGNTLVCEPGAWEDWVCTDVCS